MELIPTLKAVAKAKEPWKGLVEKVHQGLRKVGCVCARSLQGTELLLPLVAVRLLHQPKAVLLPLHPEPIPAMANAFHECP